jgi:hypothetical protein
VVKAGFCQRDFGQNQWAAAPLQRVADQWVAWGGRFRSNQFKTTFYLLAIMEYCPSPSALGFVGVHSMNKTGREQNLSVTWENEANWVSSCSADSQALLTLQAPVLESKSSITTGSVPNWSLTNDESCCGIPSCPSCELCLIISQNLKRILHKLNPKSSSRHDSP